MGGVATGGSSGDTLGCVCLEPAGSGNPQWGQDAAWDDTKLRHSGQRKRAMAVICFAEISHGQREGREPNAPSPRDREAPVRKCAKSRPGVGATQRGPYSENSRFSASRSCAALNWLDRFYIRFVSSSVPTIPDYLVRSQPFIGAPRREVNGRGKTAVPDRRQHSSVLGAESQPDRPVGDWAVGLQRP